MRRYFHKCVLFKRVFCQVIYLIHQTHLRYFIQNGVTLRQYVSYTAFPHLVLILFFILYPVSVLCKSAVRNISGILASFHLLQKKMVELLMEIFSSILTLRLILPMKTLLSNIVKLNVVTWLFAHCCHTYFIVPYRYFLKFHLPCLTINNSKAVIRSQL